MSTSVHSINLSEQWRQPTATPDEVVWERHFGTPRLANPTATVWLVGIAPGNGSLAVNGTPLDSLQAGQRFEVEITRLLQPRNVARITLQRVTAALVCQLEIRETA